MRALRPPHLAWLLLSACLSTEDVSLGALPTEIEVDAGADAAALLDAQEASADPADAAEEHDARSWDDADSDEDEQRGPDAGVRAEAGADAASDAAQPADAARDGSSSDASDGNVPLICILEPWHCR